MLRIIEDGSGSKGNGLLTDLDELAREGARRMHALTPPAVDLDSRV